jgi:hypothetical protein
MQTVAGLHHFRFKTDNFKGFISVAQTVLPTKCYVQLGDTKLYGTVSILGLTLMSNDFLFHLLFSVTQLAYEITFNSPANINTPPIFTRCYPLGSSFPSPL